MEANRKKNNFILGVGALILVLFSVIIVFSFSRYSDNARKSHFKEKHAVTIVTDYSSIGYFVQGDSVVGINADLVKVFQQYTDLKLEIVLESSLEKSIDGLYSGKYDIVARSIPVTSELKDKVLFSEPIAQSKLVLVQRKLEYNDSIPPVRSHLDLSRKTLYVSKQSPAILRIKNLAQEIGDTIYYVEDELYGEEQLAIMVAEKEIDYAVCDEKIAKVLEKAQPELDLDTNLGFTQFEAWVVNKDETELLDTLNVWISKAKEAKKIDKIYKNYLPTK